MHHKFNLCQIVANANKYDFLIENYILPKLSLLHATEELPKVISNKQLPIKKRRSLKETPIKKRRSTKEVPIKDKPISKKDKIINPIKVITTEEVLEAFKKEASSIEPSACVWEFMSKAEILEIKEIKRLSKLKKFIDNKLKKLQSKGLARTLLIDLFVSVIKFSHKNLFEPEQTGSFLTIMYNTHKYFTHNLWATPEEIYNFFKEYLYFNCTYLPPIKTKLFEIKQCKEIAVYFCKVYLRNMPLMRLLMLPNYAILLNTTEEVIPATVVKHADTKKEKGAKKKKK